MVDTEFLKETGGSKGIPPKQVAEEFFNAWQKDEYEIHVGQISDFYKIFLTSPSEALKLMNPKRMQLTK